MRGIDLLRTRYALGEHLLSQVELDLKHLATWTQMTADLVRRVFGEDRAAEEFASLDSNEAETELDHGRMRERLKARVTLLGELIERAENLYSEPSEHSGAPARCRVFVARGADDALLQAVTGFVERIGCEPIVSAVGATERLSAIEQFERAQEVEFALVLLSEAETRPDAQRQTVPQSRLLELGFFLGKLGRERVCALYRESLEMPPYGSGVPFIALDENGNWQGKLAKALSEAGVAADYSRIAMRA